MVRALKPRLAIFSLRKVSMSSGGFWSRLFGRRAAATVANSAQTVALKNALSKYLAATKNMNRNGIIKAINNKPNGGNKSYKNLIANSIAQIVANSRKAVAKAATAVANGAPESPAAAAVNAATAKINNLNKPTEVTTEPKAGMLGLAKPQLSTNTNENVQNAYKAAVNQVRTIVKSNNANNAKVNAVIAAAPTLNYNKLKNMYANNNANRENIVRILNLAKTKARPGAAEPSNETGGIFKTNEEKKNARNALNKAIKNVNSLTTNSNVNTIKARRNALKNAINQAAINGVLNKNKANAATAKMNKFIQNARVSTFSNTVLKNNYSMNRLSNNALSEAIKGLQSNRPRANLKGNSNRVNKINKAIAKLQAEVNKRKAPKN